MCIASAREHCAVERPGEARFWPGCLPVLMHVLGVEAAMQWASFSGTGSVWQSECVFSIASALPHRQAILTLSPPLLSTSLSGSPLFVQFPAPSPPHSSLLPAPLPSLCYHSLPTDPRRALSWLKTPIKQEWDTNNHRVLCGEGQLEAGLTRASSGTSRKTLCFWGMGA